MQEIQFSPQKIPSDEFFLILLQYAKMVINTSDSHKRTDTATQATKNLSKHNLLFNMTKNCGNEIHPDKWEPPLHTPFTATSASRKLLHKLL